MIKLPKHIERRMPKEVPVLRARDLENRSLVEWIGLVFGAQRGVVAVLFTRARIHDGMAFQLFVVPTGVINRQRAANAWNAIMSELGYTEPLEGRWHP